MGHQDILADQLDQASDKFKRGKIDRRQFLSICAALGLTPIVIDKALADSKEIVVAHWGGDTGKAIDTSFIAPFAKDSGLKAVNDGSGTAEGKIKAMVDSKNVIWDVIDTGVGTILALGKNGYLEKIDYSVVDKSKVIGGFTYDYGVANYMFSYVLGYDKTKFGGKEPQSWADFWNTKDFPGKRGFRKDIQGMLEVALMADGVPLDKIYPIDEKRAFAKLKEIKKDSVYWTFGAQSQQLLREGEVTMSVIWSTRVKALFDDTQGRCKWTWNQGILCPGVWAIPKGNPGGKNASQFIASAQDPARQIELFKLVNGGPANPAAASLVPPDQNWLNPSSTENVAKQLKIGFEWYGQNQSRLQDQLIDFIAS